MEPLVGIIIGSDSDLGVMSKTDFRQTGDPV